MRKATLTAALLIAGAPLVMLTGCGDGPTHPAKPVSNAVMTNLQLTGPSTIEPGGTAAYTMMSVWSDGKPRDMTAATTWTSSRPAIVSVNAQGIATGHERGEAVITGSVGGPTSTRQVMVLPAGTFRLSGLVMEGTNIPVVGVRIEARSASGTVSATTTQDGSFSLFGVANPAEVHLSKDGYLPESRPVILTQHTFMPFTLKPSGPTPDISGRYTLSINARGCMPSMPEELRRRTYAVEITQGPDQVVTLTLRVPNFTQRVFGSVGAAGVLFRLTEADPYYRTPPAVVEQLPDGTFLTITGLASLIHNADGLQGTLNGVVAHTKTPNLGLGLAECGSTTHDFVMVRADR